MQTENAALGWISQLWLENPALVCFLAFGFVLILIHAYQQAWLMGHFDVPTRASGNPPLRQVKPPHMPAGQEATHHAASTVPAANVPKPIAPHDATPRSATAATAPPSQSAQPRVQQHANAQASSILSASNPTLTGSPRAVASPLTPTRSFAAFDDTKMLRAYLRERTRRNQHAWVTAEDFRADLNKWCKDNRQPMLSPGRVGSLIGSFDYKITRRNGRSVYNGLRLVTQKSSIEQRLRKKA
jgi:hypothetical protein